MKWKKFILLSCAMPCIFAVSTATAQIRGHRAPMARMPIQRTPMLSSASGFHRFNDGDLDRDDQFRHFHRFNKQTFIFVDSFGFPFFYTFPYFGYYPYGDDPYGHYGYDSNEGSVYESGYRDKSMVAEAQRLLARAGYYHGTIDGIMGPQTRRAIRAYERDHNMRAYGAIGNRLEVQT